MLLLFNINYMSRICILEHLGKVRVPRITLDFPVTGAHGVFSELAKLLWDLKKIEMNKESRVTQKMGY